MNAQQCYDAVIKASNSYDRQVKESIYAGIRAAVQDNLLWYTYSGKITKELWAELEAAGFKVEAGSQHNEDFTSISWDLA
jgi:hypothetical protein